MLRDALHTMLPATADLADDGRLKVGGCVVADVVAQVGTPALLVDEEGLRTTARAHLAALRSRHPKSDVYFASKAFPCPAVAGLFADEGLGCDVVSAGELMLALAGGVPPQRILMHGNAKTDTDLRAALDAGIGLIVVDGFDEIDRLERLAERPQRVLLRVNPGVFAPTHEAMATGHDGSKFGVVAEDVPAAIGRIERLELVELEGLHAHIGSQILELEPFARCAQALAGFGEFATYDLGGGLGVRYTPDDAPAPTVEAYADVLVGAVHEHLGDECRIIVEPGRSLVAQSGVTAYTAVTVKRGAHTFLALDGGMGDNLEPMLYGQRFAPLILDPPPSREPETCAVVGPHCETGDRLVGTSELPRPQVGDVVLLPVTGAYCYTLANNYNGARRPPVVLLRDGDARTIVRRETAGDLLKRQVLDRGAATFP